MGSRRVLLVTATVLTALGVAGTAVAQQCDMYAVMSRDSNQPVIYKLPGFDGNGASSTLGTPMVIGNIYTGDDTDGDASVAAFKGYLYVTVIENPGSGDNFTIYKVDPATGKVVSKVRTRLGHEHSTAAFFDPGRRSFLLYNIIYGDGIYAFRKRGGSLLDGSNSIPEDYGSGTAMNSRGKVASLGGESPGDVDLFWASKGKFRSGNMRNRGPVRWPRAWANQCDYLRVPGAVFHPMTDDLYFTADDFWDWECPGAAAIFHLDPRTRVATEVLTTGIPFSDLTVICH